MLTPSLRLNFGRNITVEQNIFNATGQQAIVFGAINDSGTASYSDNWKIKNNIITGLNAYRFTTFAESLVKAEIEGNTVNVSANIFSSSLPVSNPNVFIDTQETVGLLFTAGNNAKNKLQHDVSVKRLNIRDNHWSLGHFKIGSYYLWVDGGGNLRIKNGKPTADNDGVTVGSQA